VVLGLSLGTHAATQTKKASSVKASSAKMTVERKAASDGGSASAASGSASSSVQTSSAGAGYRVSEMIRGRLSVGGSLNTASILAADDISLNFNGGKVKGGMDFNTASALAVTAQYAAPLRGLPVDATVGMTAENTREIESTSGAVTGNFSNQPTFQPWILNAGAAYQVNEKVSIPVNLNYTLLNFVRSGDVFKELTMAPQVGYQFGVNVKLAPQLVAEVLQREVRYNVSGKGDGFRFESGTTKMAGLNISVRYLF